MKIDCHTHIGRNEHINATVDQLLRSMDDAGIEKSLVFAGSINDCPNDYLAEQIAPHKDRLKGVAYYDPQVNCSELKSIIEDNQFVAVKFYTGYDHYFPNEVWYVLELCKELNIPAIFHCGDCLNSIKCAKLKYSHPLNIDEVAVDFPNVKFVIAHMGNPWIIDTAEICYKNENVYTDMSGFVYGSFTHNDYLTFRKYVSQFLEVNGGFDKLLFGSDWPISNQKSYVNTIVKTVDENYLDSIFSENAKRVFNVG